MKPHSAPIATPAQIRAARAMLDWSANKLAARSGISSFAIGTYERESRQMRPLFLRELVQVLSDAGIEILPDGGVSPKRGFRQ